MVSNFNHFAFWSWNIFLNWTWGECGFNMCEAETLHCFLEEEAIIRGGYYQTCIKAHHQAPPSNQLLNFLRWYHGSRLAASSHFISICQLPPPSSPSHSPPPPSPSSSSSLPSASTAQLSSLLASSSISFPSVTFFFHHLVHRPHLNSSQVASPRTFCPCTE